MPRLPPARLSHGLCSRRKNPGTAPAFASRRPAPAPVPKPAVAELGVVRRSAHGFQKSKQTNTKTKSTPMKPVKQFIISIYAVALAAFGHAAAPTQPDVYDLFRLGEIYRTCTTFTYNVAMADQLAAKYEGHIQFIEKLGAPEKYVSSAKAYKDVATKMPWNKPYSEWADAEKKAWQAIDFDNYARDEWFKTLNDHGFHYFLGLVSLSCVYSVGQGVLERGEAIATLSWAIRASASASKFAQTDAGFVDARSKANPAVLEALKQVTSISAKLDDPLAGELTTTDVTALRDAGLQLRSLAKDKKLLK